MIYVLMFSVVSALSGQSSTSITTQEFNSEKACRYAGSIMSKHISYGGKYVARYECFAKGVEK